jgi:hypothetical protein
MPTATEDRAAAAARWLVEALETGCALAHLPPYAMPADMDEAQETALAVLEELEITPCGLRLLHRPEGPALVGPMIEGRLVRNGAVVAPESLRHAEVTAAVIGVLAQSLEAGTDAPPVFARLHPAIDIAATRFTEPPDDPRLLTADLARIGLVVAGRAKALQPGTHTVALAPKGKRPRGTAVDVAAALREAANAARRLGGLPAGALLVVAGLSPALAAEGSLHLTVGGLGGADASFALQSGAAAAEVAAAAAAPDAG